MRSLFCYRQILRLRLTINGTRRREEMCIRDRSDELLIRSIPQAMAQTDFVCSSVNVGSTKTGINMDAVRLMGEIVKDTAEATKDRGSLGCAKLVVLCLSLIHI